MVHQVDAQLLKRKLAGTGSEASVNCAVVSDGHAAYLRVDKNRSSKKLQEELLKELESGNSHWVHKYYGTAYADAFPGVLLMTLNKPASAGLARLLTIALRGSGYRKVKISGTEGSDAA